MRRGNLGAGLTGFMQGLAAGQRLRNAVRQAREADEMRGIAGAQPETIESTNLTETTANAQGMAYDSDTGQYLSRYLDPTQPSGMTDQGLSQNMGLGHAPAPVQPTHQANTVRQYKLLGKTYDQAPTDSQQNAARMTAMADVTAKYGDPMNAMRLRSASLGLADAERKHADNEELRRVLGSGGVAGSLADPQQADPQPQNAAAPVSADGAPPSLSQEFRQHRERRDLDAYLARAQQAVGTLVKQGRVAEAKQLADFSESEQGRKYTGSWLRGMRLHSVGDDEGALREFNKLYDDLWPDGRKVKLTPAQGGMYRADQIDADGNVVSTKTMPLAELARMSGTLLQPSRAVEFYAQQQAKRDAEASAMQKSLALEDLRGQREESREDRRDARLDRQLAAGERNLERRLEHRGGLTSAQERSNFEVDAAREMIDGLSAEDIRQRTTPTTASGRDNPSYDGALARAAKLAARRKVGTDDWFDQRQGRRSPAAPASDGNDIAARFRADPKMGAYTMGRETPNGVEVLSQGRVIGHYR